MEKLTDSFILELLNSVDPDPIFPTHEDLFIAFLLCKNLDDLCETGIAILNDMNRRKIVAKGLPCISNIENCRIIFRRFYSNNMFIDHPELGNEPCWDVICSFDPARAKGAYRIYRIIKSNFSSPIGVLMQSAIKERNMPFIVKNFDAMLNNIPSEFKESLAKFKNFIGSAEVPAEHRECVYIFFESLLELLFVEPSLMEELKRH